MKMQLRQEPALGAVEIHAGDIDLKIQQGQTVDLSEDHIARLERLAPGLLVQAPPEAKTKNKKED